MTTKDLKQALAAADGNARAAALRTFRGTDFDVKALPLLRRALNDKYVQVVIDAAGCVGKLGRAALDTPEAEKEMPAGDGVADLVTQLTLAGSKFWAYSGYANCYSACLDALVSLGAEEDVILEYVHNHIGLVNPDDLLDSLKALQAVGSPEALDLFGRAVAFWQSELNKGMTKKVQALVAKGR